MIVDICNYVEKCGNVNYHDHKLFIIRREHYMGLVMNMKFYSRYGLLNFYKVVCLMIMLVAGICLCLAASHAEDDADQSLLSKDEAARMIVDSLVQNLTDDSNNSNYLNYSNSNMGLRVNQYPELLDAQTEVREANPDEAVLPRTLVCLNESWLFFFDLAPGAHFAHPTIIALVDAVSGEIQYMDAEWWPVIDVPVFADEMQRNDSETIVYERQPGV